LQEDLEDFMTGSLRLIVAAAFAAGSILAWSGAADAQQEQQHKQQPKPNVQRQGGPRSGPRAMPPRMSQPKVQPRMQQVQPRMQPRVQPQIQTNRAVNGPRNFNRGPVGPQPNAQFNRRPPNAGPQMGMRAIAPRTVGRTVIHGRNYSVWRGGPYRKRYGNGWRTFVALSALGAISIGSAAYYPYAYIDAPADYCQGFTEDGCQLQWAEVPTIEGYSDYQCVAYCPWQ
jgi:hypothetical protein